MSGTLSTSGDASNVASSAEAVIQISNLVKRYGTFTAVDNIDLTVYRNEIFGILGPNGAGKTTTLEMVEGLRHPDSGSIHVAGVDVIASPTEVKRVIGVQLQTTALFDYLTARELIELFAALSGGDTSRSRVDELLSMVALDEKGNAYVNQLSGGQRQRLSIALSVVNDPKVLFLDEPTTGLDPQARRNLWDLIRGLRASGKTVVLTTHYMEEAEVLCDRVAVMDHGRIIAIDSPLSLIQSLGDSATIRARVDREIDIADLESLPGVTGANVRDGQLTVHTEDVPATLMSLLRIAEQRRITLENLASDRPTLEDVFLSFTGRSLRE
jgi:ABC-2 type transport system ATP-binding protein